MAGRQSDSRLVYSTDGGRVRGLAPHNRVIAPPSGAQPQGSGRPEPPDDGVVRIQRDRKGRGGKTMTSVTGLPGSEADLDGLVKRLKASLGTGGTREGRTLLFQGDQRERLRAALDALGHRPKLAGG